MIVADTGAVLALVDADDRHHRVLSGLFAEDPASWVLPWAILPEVDYLVSKHLGPDVALTFLEDLARGAWIVHWGAQDDLESERCTRISGRTHRALTPPTIRIDNGPQVR